MKGKGLLEAILIPFKKINYGQKKTSKGLKPSGRL
jgi:hypothetical protein